MQKKLLLLLLCACFCLSPLASCAPVTGEGYLTFKDSTGATVTLPEKPRRVAVLFSSFAEMWTLAGGEVAVSVGESVERGFCKKGTPLVDAGAGKTVNVELLVAQEADFVIGSADIPAQVEAARTLRELGIPCALFRVESFEDYLRVFKIMTDVTENADAYETYGEAVKREVAQIRALAPTGGKKILFIRAGSSARATKAKTSDGHFAAAMLEELGCQNIADKAPILLDGLSMEAILRENPDYIFITTMGDEERSRAYMDSLLQSEVWQSLDAVKNGAYRYLPKELFQFKPNARWDAAYRYLWEILYEEAGENNR